MAVKAFVSLLDGLPISDPNAQLEISHDDSYLVIEEKGFKGFKSIVVNTFKIPLENLIDTIITTENELLEKNKSVIGRGVVGGLVFGPAGLILGGLSGIGKKKRKKVNHLFIVSYLSSSDEVKNITFTMPSLMVSVTKKFDNELKKYVEEKISRSDKVLDLLKQEQQNEFLL